MIVKTVFLCDVSFSRPLNNNTNITAERGTVLYISIYFKLFFVVGGVGRCAFDHVDLEVYCDVALC